MIKPANAMPVPSSLGFWRIWLRAICPITMATMLSTPTDGMLPTKPKSPQIKLMMASVLVVRGVGHLRHDESFAVAGQSGVSGCLIARAAANRFPHPTRKWETTRLHRDDFCRRPNPSIDLDTTAPASTSLAKRQATARRVPYPLGDFHSVLFAVFRLQPLPTLQLMGRRWLADILANQPCPV